MVSRIRQDLQSQTFKLISTVLKVIGFKTMGRSPKGTLNFLVPFGGSLLHCRAAEMNLFLVGVPEVNSPVT